MMFSAKKGNMVQLNFPKIPHLWLICLFFLPPQQTHKTVDYKEGSSYTMVLVFHPKMVPILQVSNLHLKTERSLTVMFLCHCFSATWGTWDVWDGHENIFLLLNYFHLKHSQPRHQKVLTPNPSRRKRLPSFLSKCVPVHRKGPATALQGHLISKLPEEMNVLHF